MAESAENIENSFSSLDIETPRQDLRDDGFDAFEVLETLTQTFNCESINNIDRPTEITKSPDHS